MRRSRWIAVAIGGVLLLSACGPDGGGMRASGGSSDAEVELPDQVVDRLEDTRVPRLDESSGISSFRGADDDESAMVAYLRDVTRRLDKTWTRFFEQSGLKEPFVTWIFLRTSDGPYESRCLAATEDIPLVVDTHAPNAFFCAADPDPARLPAAARRFADPYGAIILPVATMIDLRNGIIFDRGLSKTPGDFAVAFTVAHEFGHHIVSEIGNQVSTEPPQGKSSELIADCMAGIWAFAAHYENYLQPGDVDEAIATLELIGDPGPLDNSHGTAAERIAAFEMGYTTGMPVRCVESYWWI